VKGLRRRGFTLVEVLVALVIVAAGSAAVLSALTTAAASTTYLREKTFAQWIAGNRIAEARVALAPPQDGDTEGDLEFAGQRWQWRQEIKQGEIPGLRRIDVRVRPAGSTAAADQWTASLSGVLGRDIAPATGAEPDWDPAPSGGPPGDNGAPADGQSPESGTPAGGDPMQPPPDAGIQPAGEGAT
jgi:general secretion pathway protein I